VTAERADASIGPHRRRGRWELSGEAFDRLLAAFDPDRDRAGEQYERLRQKLIVIFAARRCRWPERLADEAMDRTARKIVEGEQIVDIGAYVYRVAGFVHLEEAHDPARRTEPVDELGSCEPEAGGPPEPERVLREEHMHECLEACLQQLSPDQRTLVLSIPQGEKGDKVRNRKRLARQLGISPGALRTRACRARALLSACVTDCLAAEEGNPKRIGGPATSSRDTSR
jgi:DNA-directed RNA polymerase specialized sigma24 family protein